MEGKFYKIQYRHREWSDPEKWRIAFGEYEEASPYDDSFGHRELADAVYNRDSLRLWHLGQGYEFRIIEISYSISSRVMDEAECVGH